jgi:hypothetical protein
MNEEFSDQEKISFIFKKGNNIQKGAVKKYFYLDYKQFILLC